ncbi:hypothetical protein SCIP_0681 [Scardovia inopinata JCM 12537]|nr:hypothetical protein SCIP_0681 [Scardovia inopinata JCM 12537]
MQGMVPEKKQPQVSEKTEGKPWFEWLAAGAVLLACLTVLSGHMKLATGIIAGFSLITALIRLIFRDRSPWKVRTVSFDCFIGFSLGFGLILVYISILLIS